MDPVVLIIAVFPIAQLSSITGATTVTAASHEPGSAVCVWSAATVRLGFSLSVTVMSWVSCELLPWISVTVHVTVVVPTG